MQSFGKVSEDVCLPGEVAILEWSLASGIMDDCHAILVPWKIENEFVKDRLDLISEQTHKINFRGFPDGQDFATNRKNFLRVSSLCF